MTKFDPKHRMDMMLSPERRRWQDPDRILEAIGVAEGMILVDIGTGPGFFALPAARKVGAAGKVYAIDVEPAMLERVRERAEAEGITNVETMLSQEDRLPLPSGAADTALMANVLHEVEDPVKLLKEVARVLKAAGTLAVVEWNREPGEWGPPMEDRLAPEQLEALLRESGYTRVESFDVGPRHYGMLGRK